MDVVLVGLPGSGKSAVGRRLAHRHGATFIDLDDAIEAGAGMSVPAIFEAEGEAGFRAREAAAVEALGSADRERPVRRVIATGGGTMVDPRNRWRLAHGRVIVWLDGRPEALAQRLRHSRTVRPLIAGRDPIGAVRALGAARERFYAIGHKVNALAEPTTIAREVAALVADGPGATTRLLDAGSRIGRFVIGDGIAADLIAETLADLEARRAILVSEPGAWAAAGAAIEARLHGRGLEVATIQLPQGEAAKRLEVIGEAARRLAVLRAERREPLVAIGGGALGDAAGLLAALWLRGVPVIHVPTTLVAQIDASIGGKTAVDLAEGKNLLGAFHQPVAVIVDVSVLRTLPERHRRAALGEAVKMAVLGDERLFGLLERDGDAIARGDDEAFASGAVAELVERCLWAKVEVVLADEREQGGATGRIALNLGHSAGHALEAAGGYEALLHGEAVAYGTRIACRLGTALGVTPPARADRVERLLDALGLGVGRLPYPLDAVLELMATDKKHAAGRLRWVVPTADGFEVRTDVPDELVRATVGGLLEERPSAAVASGPPAAGRTGR